jgi:hypothetical protein
MATGTRSIDADARALREIGAGTACLLAVTAGVQLVAGYLPNPLSRSVVSAIGVSLVAGAVGLEADRATPAARRRAAHAAKLTLLASLVTLVAALALGGRIEAGELGLGTVFGLAESVATAYRDELWLRGLPFYFARRAGVPLRWLLPFLVATGVCAVLADPASKPSGLLLVGASGLAFATFWVTTRDLWAPVAANAAWRIAGDVLFSGDALELGPHKLPTTPGASGVIAWVSAAAMLGVALTAWRDARPAAVPAPSDDVTEPEEELPSDEASEPEEELPSDDATGPEDDVAPGSGRR